MTVVNKRQVFSHLGFKGTILKVCQRLSGIRLSAEGSYENKLLMSTVLDPRLITVMSNSLRKTLCTDLLN